jgi:hypothetical protein
MKTNPETTRFSMHFNPSEILHFGGNFRAIYFLADANYLRNVFGSRDCCKYGIDQRIITTTAGLYTVTKWRWTDPWDRQPQREVTTKRDESIM